MKYEFDRDDAYRFRNHVRAEARTRGDELQFVYCPYCGGGSHKDKGSFSINLKTGQFECKRSSCAAKGNMITLSRDFDFSISEEIDRYYNRNDYNKRFRTFRKAHISVKDGAVAYLSTRGISEAVTRKYELTTVFGKDNILAFPFKDQNNELKFIKYRKMDFDKNKDKSKEWCEANCMPILFGMNHCKDFNRLIITEGQIDSLSVAECGIDNAVSVPTGCNGFTWLPHCWDWFVRFEELIIFGDYENGKVSLAETLTKRFPNRVKIVRAQNYMDCKDANELLQKHGKQAVIDAIENAEEVPLKQIKRLADVEAVDILNSEAISTGVKKIDDLLSGGMHLGQLVLLTGKRGDGKSTWMSQLIVEATEQGYASFVYSGELMDFYFKRWIDMQIAGRKELSNSVINKLNSWYYDKIFLYDNNIIDDEETEELIKVVENAICKYGVKFVCLDNLMTAIDVGMNEDLYRAQSRFVGKLAKMAKVHNVVILLVAHPRKAKEGSTNDNVAGSSDITNKVDIVMSYERISNDVNNHRKLEIAKNRLTGKLTSSRNEIILKYSEESKRIVEISDSFDRVYSWDTENSGFMEIPDSTEIPF